MSTRFTQSLLALSTLGLLLIASTTWARQICSARYQAFIRSYQAKPQSLPMTVGIEIEGFVKKDDSTYEGMAKAIQARLKKRYSDVKVKTLSEGTDPTRFRIEYTRKDGIRKEWNVHPDDSIETEHLKLEISSPILDSPEDFFSFQEVLAAVKKKGARAEPLSAGVHIHIGFDDPGAGEVATLASVVSEIEEELLKRFGRSSARSMHTLPTDILTLDVLQAGDLDSPEFLYQLIGAQEKNHVLNLHALGKHGTVEFRLFNSTFELDELELMQDFASKLVHAIRTKDPALMNYLTRETGDLKLERLTAILKTRLGNPGSEAILARILDAAKKARLNKYGDPAIRRLAILLGTAGTIRSISQRSEKLSPAS